MSDARPRQPANGAGFTRGDTIVAVATAHGRGAVGIVRLSGRDAEAIGRRVVHPWPRVARRLTRCTLVEPRSGDVLDDGMAVFFPAPTSYTGEAVVEAHVHGGTYVPDVLAAAFVAAGARPALPGEFTERAYLNGKLDLVHAEAIREIIEARTFAAHRAAMAGLSGALARQFNHLRDAALSLEALIAFDIDFPDEDHGPIARDDVERAASALERQLCNAADGTLARKHARDGATVVLAGPPNAGKSSLLNALVGEARAIVSDVPGTTRDAIEVFVDGDPWPVRYVDTAGLRESAAAIERLGMEVSERYLRSADVVLLCTPGDDPRALQERIRQLTPAESVVVHTKSDLYQASPDAMAVSSVTGDGLAQLRQRVMDAVSARAGGLPRADRVINARQQAAVDTALGEVRAFLTGWRAAELPTPVLGTHLRAAVHALEDLIGVVTPDDVLGRVFSTFCVGK